MGVKILHNGFIHIFFEFNMRPEFQNNFTLFHEIFGWHSVWIFSPRVFTVTTFRISNFSARGSLTRHKLSKYASDASKFVYFNTSISDSTNAPMNGSYNHSLIRIVITGPSVISMYFDCAVRMFFTPEESMLI